MIIPNLIRNNYRLVLYLTASILVLSFKAYPQTAHFQNKINSRDTIVTTKRLINSQFNEIFIQNTKPSFFGWEYGDPTKSLLCADLASNFIVLNSPQVRALLLFTTRVKGRMFDEQSTPVKSLSFMPGATLFVRKNADPDRPKFYSISYAHHSNGQSGPALNPDGTFNRDSGNFTTNFYSLNYHFGKSSTTNKLIRNRYAALGLEIHAGLFNLGYEQKLRDRYGFLRVNGSWNYFILKNYQNSDNGSLTGRQYNNWQRMQLEFSYIVDKYNGYSLGKLNKRLNITGKYYYHFPFMDNVSLMLGAGYKGQDDYNIYFEDSYSFITFGLTAHTSFAFGKKPHS